MNDDSIGAGIEPSETIDIAVAGDGLVAVGSAGFDSGPAVWLSPDGFTWNRLLDSMTGDQSGFEAAMRPMTALAAGERGLVAVGSQLRQHEDLTYAERSTTGPLVWVAADGFEWRLLDPSFIELADELESSRYAYMKARVSCRAGRCRVGG